ncbi:MAG: hypothetical protein HOH43_02525 [Candidatus Latescibacteria bacterium]|nr:hypothetical protein [Candidatus Latescibacterota bacterium]
MKKTGLLVCVLFAVGGGAYWYKHSDGDVTAITGPREESNLWGLSLGMSEADVIFHKGKPKERAFGKEEKAGILYYNYGNWRVSLFEGKVHAIWFGGKSFEYSDIGIQGIKVGDGIETVVSKYGEPSKISEASDHTWRTYWYSQYQVVFSFQKGVVMTYGIWKPREKQT